MRGADWWMSHVPADSVAFWDFDDPAIPTTERDTAATAIAAAALLKLALVGPEDRRARYRDFAEVTRRGPHRPAPHGGRRSHRRLLQQAPGWSAGGRRQPLRVDRRSYYLFESLLAFAGAVDPRRLLVLPEATPCCRYTDAPGDRGAVAANVSSPGGIP